VLLLFDPPRPIACTSCYHQNLLRFVYTTHHSIPSAFFVASHVTSRHEALVTRLYATLGQTTIQLPKKLTV
jgi:hypothetical protein